MTEHDHGSRHGFRFQPERRQVLKDEGRKEWLPPEPILEALRIEEGATIVDVGAGTGFWTLPLSQLIGPSGKVIAVDVEPIMLDELRTLIDSQNLSNVELVHSEELRIPLADAVADGAVLGFVLHEPDDPPALLREITRLLRPRRKILVVEFHKRVTEQGPPLAPRLAEEETKRMLEDAGFRVESLPAPNPDVYVLMGDTGADSPRTPSTRVE